MIRAIAALLLGAAAAHPQAGDFTLRVDVPALSIDVSVTDREGRPVHGLTPDDFEILEDGVPQPIRYFAPSTAPYHAYVLMDVSGSTEGKRDFMFEAVSGFVASLAPQDRVSIGAFGHTLATLIDWSSPSPRTAAALEPVLDLAPMAGTTEFYRSLEAVLEDAFDGIAERKAVVVLTDGRETSIYQELAQRSRLLAMEDDGRFRSLYRRAAESGAALYFVGLNTDENLEVNRDGADEYRNLGAIFGDSPLPELYLEQIRLRMESLAEVSGGKVFLPLTIADVVEPFEEIAESLGGAYSLGYAPPEGSGDTVRQITVRLRELPYEVRQSRTGYRFLQ